MANDGLKKFLEKNADVPNIGLGGMDSIVNGKSTPFIPTPEIGKQRRDKRGSPSRDEMVSDPVKQAAVVLNKRLMELTNEFFQFYKVNKSELDKCADKIRQLEEQYQKWLSSRGGIYDLEVCKPLFLERMENAFDSSVLAVQMNQAFPNKPKQENISE